MVGSPNNVIPVNHTFFGPSDAASIPIFKQSVSGLTLLEQQADDEC
jgi:hypothetical protein